MLCNESIFTFQFAYLRYKIQASESIVSHLIKLYYFLYTANL